MPGLSAAEQKQVADRVYAAWASDGAPSFEAMEVDFDFDVRSLICENWDVIMSALDALKSILPFPANMAVGVVKSALQAAKPVICPNA